MKKQDIRNELTELAISLLVEAERVTAEMEQAEIGADGHVNADALAEGHRTWARAVDQVDGILLAGARLGLDMPRWQEVRRLATERWSATEKAATLRPAG